MPIPPPEEIRSSREGCSDAFRKKPRGEGGNNGPGSAGVKFRTGLPLPRARNPVDPNLTNIYYGAQNLYTHTIIILELISQLHRTSVTRGFLAGISLCKCGRFHKVLSVNVPITH